MYSWEKLFRTAATTGLDLASVFATIGIDAGCTGATGWVAAAAGAVVVPTGPDGSEMASGVSILSDFSSRSMK